MVRSEAGRNFRRGNRSCGSICIQIPPLKDLLFLSKEPKRMRLHGKLTQLCMSYRSLNINDSAELSKHVLVVEEMSNNGSSGTRFRI